MRDLRKDPSFLVRSEMPFNGGPPLDRLVENFLTPRPLFFVRNHGTIPALESASFRLAVGGEVRQALELSLEDLKRSFTSRSVTATLQCAGNRRQELAGIRAIPGELPWGPEAIGTAVWTGVSLAEVLAGAGVDDGSGHVEFRGRDLVERGGREIGYGGSISTLRAAGLEVLLAWEMNGEPLPPEHGFPLRVVVPGVIGARSVKWLQSIHVRRTPSPHYFQQRAYKLFAPWIRSETADWEGTPPLEVPPVNSVICRVEGRKVRGYAISGAGGIREVQVSVDGGQRWTPAALDGTEPWAWTLWEAVLDTEPRGTEITVRAKDSAGHRQPEHADHVWNFKGYLNNAWHRLRTAARG